MYLGVGNGTFYKIEEETIIKENSIVNIGESFLVFSFMNKELETEEQFGENDLILKIYSNNQEYDQLLFKVVNGFIKLEDLINVIYIY